MTRIAVVAGTTRASRLSRSIAEWAVGVGREHGRADYEVLDVADFDLELYDEPEFPHTGRYTKASTRRWADAVAGFDGYVFVTGEYNHSIPASLKNALDVVHQEWGDKAATFISYGSSGGVRAVEHLRLVLAEVRVATIAAQVRLVGGSDDFVSSPPISVSARREQDLVRALRELERWAGALAGLRSEHPVAFAPSA